MNRYDLAIILLTDATMETLPYDTRYQMVKEMVSVGITGVTKKIRAIIEKGEKDA